MRRIHQLEPHVADLIAAGEVVQRPASVVKELVENAIDAGSGIITIEIKDGGMTFIRVTDNGSGIAPDDVEVAFMRHATSKLRNAGELEAIGTLGFRGEALAAIAAVSRIELTTREQSADEGVRLLLEAGTPGNAAPFGCPEGTTIIVRDLFFNTPARLKFIKSNRTEGAAIASTVLFTALSHPEISFRFIKDGKTEYHTPGDYRADSCIYSLFGRDFSSGLIPVNSELAPNSQLPAVSGFVSAPNMSRGNRGFQFFVLNGRTIRSKMLQAALEQAYANLLPSGRFPSCVLYIKTRLSDVDVNVHPTKTEVKFSSDKEIFDAVYYAVLGALGTQSAANSELSNSVMDFTGSPLKHQEAIGDCGSEAAMTSSPRGGFKSFSVNEYNKPYDKTLRSQNADTLRHGTPRAVSPTANAQSPSNAQLSTNSEFRIPNSEFRLIGEVLNTYIVLEVENAVLFIDKHAAHERIHFNALKSDNYDPMSQTLMVPTVCRFGAEDAAVLLENVKLLDNLGFSIESFGESAVAVRRIPSEIGINDVESILSKLCELLRHSSHIDSEHLDKIYRTISCGSSIKAGSLSDTRELETLASRVISGEITHCPHGRPVMFELSKSKLDKEFGRI